MLLKYYTSVKEISTTQDVISLTCRCIVQISVILSYRSPCAIYIAPGLTEI